MKDPRVALFGLTLFSHVNPGLERQLETFASILEVTRKSLAAIRGEMQNYETSMLSAVSPVKATYSTQPVHPSQVEQEPVSNYTGVNYNQPSSQIYMQAEENKQGEVKEQLVRYLDQNPDNLQDFLYELEGLLRKYSRK